MDEESGPEDTTSNTSDGHTKDHTPKPVHAIEATKPATEQQLQDVKRKMNAFERSTLRWTRMTVGIGLATAVFICLQWYEMRTGSFDTHHLAVAAGKQADRMKDFADQMKDQADNTRTIANQTIIEARAAKKSADTAASELELSRRPWMMVRSAQIVDPLRIHSDGSMITFLRITVENVGGSPASAVGPVQVPFILTFGLVEQHVLMKACSIKPNLIPEIGFVGQMVFPGPEKAFSGNYSAEGKAVSFKNHPNVYSLGGMHVAGCIAYTSFYSQKAYASGFSYELRIRHNGLLVFGAQFDNGQPLAPGRTLFPSETGEVVIKPEDITLVLPYIQPPIK